MTKIRQICKIGAVVYGTGTLTTFVYVNHRLRKQLRTPTKQSNFLILYVWTTTSAFFWMVNMTRKFAKGVPAYV